MTEEYKLNLKCLFCGSTKFELPYANYQPKEGEMIKCHKCGKLNDFSFLKGLIKKEAEELAKKEIEKILKKSGFKLKK